MKNSDIRTDDIRLYHDDGDEGTMFGWIDRHNLVHYVRDVENTQTTRLESIVAQLTEAERNGLLYALGYLEHMTCLDDDEAVYPPEVESALIGLSDALCSAETTVSFDVLNEET